MFTGGLCRRSLAALTGADHGEKSPGAWSMERADHESRAAKATWLTDDFTAIARVTLTIRREISSWHRPRVFAKNGPCVSSGCLMQSQSEALPQGPDKPA
jgi:hypothetical protein